MHPSVSSLLASLFLTLPVVLAQTSTVIVVPTPLQWQDAHAYCDQIGYTIYPVPATPTDPVYEVFDAQPNDRYWIRRRTGGSCTCLSKNIVRMAAMAVLSTGGRWVFGTWS
ncbi:hypothetical protein jhhlp_000810 [Lomentospora prolificans]|uniref:C-type lectin domain-containing protein n=1 Tax=Lomentospora prolificans TaxID=41688 RepID=A0A2N3NJS1_9PEZI|nr:hypothetical protein jhhlp_000810 [Lomentospora prolificans]